MYIGSLLHVNVCIPHTCTQTDCMCILHYFAVDGDNAGNINGDEDNGAQVQHENFRY